MLSVDVIREQVSDVLSGARSLEDFEDWIASSSWNVLRHADVDVRQLVGAIELRLAEHSSGHLDDNDLFAELQTLVLQGVVSEPIQPVFISIIDPADAVVVTASSVEEGPDYQFRIEGPRTSPVTRTGSGRTVVRDPVALAS